jgi:hypothetical protein
MKPLHVGLLVVGAALAGGLAVKMTQPPTFQRAQNKPVAAPSAPAITPLSSTSTVTSAPSANPEAANTTAPSPVYREPKPAMKTSSWTPVPVKPKVTSVKVASVQIAKASAAPVPIPPPVPYQATPEPITTALPAADATAAPPAEAVRTFDPPAPMPLNPAPLQVTVRQGTQIAVRMDQSLSSDHLSAGDTFQGSLAEPLVVDGYIVAERGARVSGRVVEAQIGGRLSGNSALGLGLSSFQTADGQKIAISTEPWVKQGDTSRDQNIAKIGGGAALGAIIGAIAGGGAGAAIGAGVGGAAGTGAAVARRGKPVTIASETVVRFRLAPNVKITERPL